MTNKQRRKIYLKIANNYELFPYSRYVVCFHLSHIVGFVNNFKLVMREFPEFSLFRPTENYPLEDPWWNLNNEGYELRIMALLFCAEMCKGK